VGFFVDMITGNPSWSTIRQQILLDPAVANLNTGSFGPLPRVVFDKVTELRRRLAEEPMDFFLRRGPPLLWQARLRLAQFMGCQPERLIFTANVTSSINTIAAGLRLSVPGEILLTDHEYGAMHWCWERAAQRQGLTLRTFPLPTMAESPDEIIDAFCKAINEKTRLLFFSHILSPTGLILPAAAICAEARRRGVLTVVDGAHAPAMIPLELDRLGADFYGGNCHKWLLTPSGAGFLHFGPGNEDRLEPMQVSWGWHAERSKLDEPDEFGSTPRIRRFEFEGTRDPCAWLAVPAAIDFQDGIGWANIRTRNAGLVACTRQALGQLDLEPATPVDAALHGFMTAFRLPVWTEAVPLRQHLWDKHKIEVPVVERPDCLLLRVSTHFYNQEEEIARLEVAVKEYLQTR
jgi:isopenicillin-N epimerase